MNIQVILLVKILFAITKLSTSLPLVHSSARGYYPFAIATSANSHLQGNRVDSPRLSIAEWDHYNERDVQGPNTYAFGYDVQDAETDNLQFRHEEKLPNGTVVGSYGYVTPDGNAHIVKYIADHLGYRATVETNKRMFDSKPIHVNVEQALADDIASAELSLQNNKKSSHVAMYEAERKKYNSQYRRPYYEQKKRFPVNNKKENVYKVVENIAGEVPYEVSHFPMSTIRQPNPRPRVTSNNFALFDIYPF